MKIYIQNLKYEYELKMLFNSFTRLESQFYHISEYNESDSECIVISENSDYGPDIIVTGTSDFGSIHYSHSEKCSVSDRSIYLTM